MTIKRGVSLYSFQDEYVRGKMTVEDCVAECAQVGAYGIETLAEQMFPGYPLPGQPDLPDEFYDNLRDMMERYGTTPTVHDMFLDTKRYPNRLLTQEEMVDSLKRDIRHTAKLGAQGIRIIVNTPPEVVEEAAPYARDHGVWMGVEIHSPFSFDDEWIKRHLEVAERVGTDVVGCVPDMGIFVHRLPRVLVERARRDGGRDEVIERIETTYNEGGDTQSLLDELIAQDAPGVEVGLARNATFMIARPVKDLRAHEEFIKHIHAKFYEMYEVEGSEFPHEYSIPYQEIIPVLQDIKFDGYLSSEYEGNRHIEDAEVVDSRTQVRWHQRMLSALLGEEN